VTPVGVPTKAMLTMANSKTEHIPPQRPSNPATIDKPSFTLKESIVEDSSIRCSNNKHSNPTQALRTIPTRIPHNATNTANAANAVAVVDPDVDDDDPDPNELPTDANALTFLKEWDAFYDDFVQSSTYTRVYSNANSNLSSLADAYVRSTQTPQITSGHSQNLLQLLQVLEELEKVNDQLFQHLSALPSPAPCTPSPQNLDNNSPQPRMCPAPTLDCTPPYAPPCAMPSEPNPAAIPLQQSPTPPATQNVRLICIPGQPSPEPQLANATQHVRMQETPPALLPLQPPTQQHAPQFERSRCNDQIIMHDVPPSPTRPCGPHANPPKTTIPNWARPAVTTALNVGNPHWPPPRPNMKTTPYKKKSPAKHTVMPRTRDKDSLRPP